MDCWGYGDEGELGDGSTGSSLPVPVRGITNAKVMVAGGLGYSAILTTGRVITLLLDLDLAIQGLNRESAGNPAAVQLTGVYHNLLRRWANP